MKKIFTLQNIIAAILLLLSVAETVFMILFKPLPLWLIVLLFLFAVLGIAEIRFARQLAFWGNRWHSLWNRKNARKEDDEPSDLAVGLIKAMGYFIVFMMQIILFF